MSQMKSAVLAAIDRLAATPAPLDVMVAAKHSATVLNSCGDIYFHSGCKEAGAALRAAIEEAES
jgi:hypothetical protein